VWSAIFLVSLAGPMGQVLAEELEGSLTFSGNVLLVRVFNEKGIGAADIPLRLRDADKKIVAAGRTDVDGNWSFPLEHNGKFEVEAIGGPTDDDISRWPISWKGALPSETPPIILTLPCCQSGAASAPRPASPEDFPIETTALGIGCLGAAGMLLFLRRLGIPA
jgi:hypothetical protein